MIRKIYILTLKIQLLAGLVLILLNLIGFFYYKTINNSLMNKVSTSDPYPSVITADQFWKKAFKEPSETTDGYATRLTSLISHRITNIHAKYMNQMYPTFSENWILWLWSIKHGHHEWIDTYMAVRSGVGYCSQHSIIFNNLMRTQGINSRIIAINGHVLNEVYIPEKKKWTVFDPNFNVTLPFSLQECEDPRNSQSILNIYNNAEAPASGSAKIINFFLTTEDNYNYKHSQSYQPRLSCIEKFSFLLKWLIPLILIVNSLPPLLIFKQSKGTR